LADAECGLFISGLMEEPKKEPARSSISSVASPTASIRDEAGLSHQTLEILAFQRFVKFFLGKSDPIHTL
jgi:hypothetical protein